MKKTILILTALSVVHIGRAQVAPLPSVSNKMSETEYLFNSKKDELDINFKIDIHKGLVLHFAMTRMGLWQGKEEFKRHLLIAEEQLKLYRDSLRGFANSKRLDINAGQDNTVLSRYSTSAMNNDIRIEKNGQLNALKMGKDTLRLVKDYGRIKHQGDLLTERIQYTFEMKELNGFNRELSDDAWVDSTAGIIDSVVNIYRKKWRNPDAEYHSLYVSTYTKDSVNRLFISKRSVPDYNRIAGFLTVNGGFGVSLVRNTLCPNADVGLQFHFKSEDDLVPFVRLSMNTFMRFEEKADKKFQEYSTGFINAEIGFQSNEQSKLNKNFLLSMGFGYKLNTYEKLYRDPSMDNRMYKLFFNYNLGNNIILQPEFISSLGKRENDNGWVGITFNFRLF